LHAIKSVRPGKANGLAGVRTVRLHGPAALRREAGGLAAASHAIPLLPARRMFPTPVNSRPGQRELNPKATAYCHRRPCGWEGHGRPPLPQLPWPAAGKRTLPHPWTALFVCGYSRRYITAGTTRQPHHRPSFATIHKQARQAPLALPRQPAGAPPRPSPPPGHCPSETQGIRRH